MHTGAPELFHKQKKLTGNENSATLNQTEQSFYPKAMLLMKETPEIRNHLEE